MTFALLLCRVQDGDGEFLLIEAANSLPRWMKPETAENRVSAMTGSSFMPQHCIAGKGDFFRSCQSVPLQLLVCAIAAVTGHLVHCN